MQREILPAILVGASLSSASLNGVRPLDPVRAMPLSRVRIGILDRLLTSVIRVAVTRAGPGDASVRRCSTGIHERDEFGTVSHARSRRT
jgi:hypothetical protein